MIRASISGAPSRKTRGEAPAGYRPIGPGSEKSLAQPPKAKAKAAAGMRRGRVGMFVLSAAQAHGQGAKGRGGNDDIPAHDELLFVASYAY